MRHNQFDIRAHTKQQFLDAITKTKNDAEILFGVTGPLLLAPEEKVSTKSIIHTIQKFLCITYFFSPDSVETTRSRVFFLC